MKAGRRNMVCNQVLSGYINCNRITIYTVEHACPKFCGCNQKYPRAGTHIKHACPGPQVAFYKLHAQGGCGMGSRAKCHARVDFNDYILASGRKVSPGG